MAQGCNPMPKRLLAITIVLMLIISLCSCNNSKAPVADDRSVKNDLIAGNKADLSDTDSEHDPEALIIAYYGLASPYIEQIAEYLRKSEGMKIELVHYEDDTYALNTKLMSEDNYIDIFLTITLDIYKYVRAGYYEDLSAYPSLKERVESNNYTKNVATYEGSYFGIPCESRYMDNTIFMYNSPLLINYIKDYVDVLNGEFKDSDGSKLCEVFKKMYEKGGDEVELPLDEVDYKYTFEDYVIISPYSKHKEKAVRFLEEVFDYMNKTSKLSNEWQLYSYPAPDEDVNGMYITWKAHVPNVVMPILTARQEIMNTDGSEKAIKKLAKEAASKIAMQIEE